jgi:hypothetical protein
VTDKDLYLVFSNPLEGREDDFARWYDEIHLGEILTLDGVVSAQRFDVNGVEGAATPHRSLAIYECEGDGNEVAAVIAEAMGSGSMTLTDSIDTSSMVRMVFSPRTPRLSAETPEVPHR